MNISGNLNIQAGSNSSGALHNNGDTLESSRYNQSSNVKQQSTGSEASSEQQLVSISDKEKIREVEKALKAMQGPNTTLEISVHDKLNAIMIKVYDQDTGELIREIPPEKTLDVVAKLMEISGILLDEKV